ncbi:MAG: hypothetical protein KF723_22495 [Rhizobiaceae bacterium]|nr:hypothetical protein [Rhizobiaceae bacterium]
MVDPRKLRVVENLAAGLAEHGRSEEACRHYKAIVTALNNSHTNGVQDALTVFEGIAMMLGQLTANMGDDEREGLLTYVRCRAERYAPEFRESGKGARHEEEPIPAGARQ